MDLSQCIESAGEFCGAEAGGLSRGKLSTSNVDLIST